MKAKLFYAGLALVSVLVSCGGGQPKKNAVADEKVAYMKAKVAEYAEVELKPYIDNLSDVDERLLKELIAAADAIDRIFWIEAFGDKAKMDSIASDDTRTFAYINYGPWDRLDADKPFVESFGPKSPGSNFYPHDMTREEFEAFDDARKTSPYTMLRRDAAGKLEVIPYHVFFKKELEDVIRHLRKAAEYAYSEPLKKYLNLRADALLTDSYYQSDLAWLNVNESPIDVIIGPIENYEDILYGYKTSHSTMVLLKDEVLTQMLQHFSFLLPKMRKNLPLEDKYKKGVPLSDKEKYMGVYDVLYCGGENNSGGKTIAVSLPNDGRIRQESGSRKLMLRNVMQFKFDKIMVPIADQMLDFSQQRNMNFDAFFKNSMLRQLSQGLGLWQTVNGKGTVRAALKEAFVDMDEARADASVLYMVRQLHQSGEISDDEVLNNYVTFLVNMFRAMRFGSLNAHAVSNSLIFNYLYEAGAIERTSTGRYKIHVEKMNAATQMLSDIIVIQGDGDYDQAVGWLASKGVMSEQLTADLQRANQINIPRDVRFKQGAAVLGLK